MTAGTYGNKSKSTSIKVISGVFRALTAVSPPLAGFVALEMFRTPMKRADSIESSDAKEIKIPFLNGHLIAYEWGEGPTILLNHGWESSALRFKRLIPELVDAGFRVIALDGPAHGRSSEKRTDYLKHSEAICTTVEHLGPIYAIIAHSFGAATTVVALDRFPQIQVECVVLFGTPDKALDMFKLFKNVVDLPDKAFDHMVKLVEKRAGKTMPEYDISRIAAIRQERALIVQDREDPITIFSGGVAVADAWDGAESIYTTGLGHRRALSNNEIIEQTIAFLKAD